MADNPEAKLWGGVAPELQQLSEVTGCPMFHGGPGVAGSVVLMFRAEGWGFVPSFSVV